MKLPGQQGGTILLCAGGTGGHLFPAEALAHELRARGFDVHLATDERAGRFAQRFPASEIHVIPSATFGSRNPLAVARSMARLGAGFLRSRALLRRIDPLAVVGFGGYPTLPPVLAAQISGIATLIHDANAVMGRANRLLARRARIVALGFPGRDSDGRAILTGNPVRPEILHAAEIPYPLRTPSGKFRLLVFGGSQGAQFFSAIVPEAILRLDGARLGLLDIVQQARPEDAAGLESFYREHGIPARVAPFFDDMAGQLAQAHLVICRAGASTVSELAVMGRPAVLVPYPHALDHDQAMNAAALAETGGAFLIPQQELDAQKLGDMLRQAIDGPEKLAQMAGRAKSAGRPDAAARLADCVQRLAGLQTER